MPGTGRPCHLFTWPSSSLLATRLEAAAVQTRPPVDFGAHQPGGPPCPTAPLPGPHQVVSAAAGGRAHRPIGGDHTCSPERKASGTVIGCCLTSARRPRSSGWPWPTQASALATRWSPASSRRRGYRACPVVTGLARWLPGRLVDRPEQPPADGCSGPPAGPTAGPSARPCTGATGGTPKAQNRLVWLTAVSTQRMLERPNPMTVCTLCALSVRIPALHRRSLENSTGLSAKKRSP